MVSANKALERLVEGLRGEDPLRQGHVVEFFLDEIYVLANVRDDVDRLRIRCYLPVDDEELVRSWVLRQPAPKSGIVQAQEFDVGVWRPRLLFERPLASEDWRTDPLLEELSIYLRGWADDTDVDGSALAHIAYTPSDEPDDILPSSAWLLKGDEASYLTADHLAEYRETSSVGIHTLDWTTASQTEIGDLVLFYFLAPRKAVHFVARAASKPVFDTEIPVNAHGKVAQAQWWGMFTTPVEIEPIPVADLQEAADGHLPLRGKSGHFLQPRLIERLSFRAKDPAQQDEIDRIARVPVGLADLPQPDEVTIEQWREIAAGALRLEADVSRYLVEPLFRLLLPDPSLSWRPEYPVGRRFADYVLLDGNGPRHVVEVKRAIRQGAGGGWAGCADLVQLAWYAGRLDVPGTLIDSHRIVLVPKGADQPSREILRRSASPDDLDAIRAHL